MQAPFSTLAGQADAVDGVVLDIGVSSMQLDEAGRGFSFMREGPLDMRMAASGESAADLVNTLDEADLANLLYAYGEERKSRRIAHVIAAARATAPIATTTELARLIERAIGRKPGDAHPATRSFQALRIAVNDELGELTRALPQAVELLRPGGRLVVISFHSLEDRIVKQFMKREATDCICPSHQPMCTCNHKATLKLVTRKPIEAADEEIAHNPRARSAKLRVAEKIA